MFGELTTDILLPARLEGLLKEYLVELHVKILEERALKNGTLETVVGGRMARPVEKAFHVADGGAEDVVVAWPAWCVTENFMQ